MKQHDIKLTEFEIMPREHVPNVCIGDFIEITFVAPQMASHRPLIMRYLVKDITRTYIQCVHHTGKLFNVPYCAIDKISVVAEVTQTPYYQTELN